MPGRVAAAACCCCALSPLNALVMPSTSRSALESSPLLGSVFLGWRAPSFRLLLGLSCVGISKGLLRCCYFLADLSVDVGRSCFCSSARDEKSILFPEPRHELQSSSRSRIGSLRTRGWLKASTGDEDDVEVPRRKDDVKKNIVILTG